MKNEWATTESKPAMLFTCDPEHFWREVRQIIREETAGLGNDRQEDGESGVPLGNQTLYKIKDLCRIFSVSKPTIYEWMKLGRLKPRRIKRRVFFLEKDVKNLLEPGSTT